MMLHTNYINALGLVVSDKKIFSSYVKHVTPGLGPFSAPGA